MRGVILNSQTDVHSSLQLAYESRNVILKSMFLSSKICESARIFARILLHQISKGLS